MQIATATDVKNGWEIQLLGQEAIEYFWKDIRGLLEKVPHLWKDKYGSTEVFYQLAMMDKIQIWHLGTKEQVKTVIFTQIAVFPNCRQLEVFMFVGEGSLENGLEVMDATLTKFAMNQGCSGVDLLCRRGFKPLAEKHGFRETSVVLSRPIRERVN